MASFNFVTMHACDRQTDRRTDRITTPKTALAYARAVIKHHVNVTVNEKFVYTRSLVT